MITATMTTKERWLAAIRMQPVDRLPFWPKLDPAYRRVQPAPFRDMDLPALQAWTGSDFHTFVGNGLREIRTHTGYTERMEGNVLRKEYQAGGTTLTGAELFDEGSQSWHPVEYPIKQASDLAVMTMCFTDLQLEIDHEALSASRQSYDSLGQSALAGSVVGTSPLMEFLEFLAGVENAHLFLADEPEAVAALLDAMQRALLRRCALVAEHSPADVLYFMENTSTTLISPAQYREYCLPHLIEAGHILREAGRLIVVHMCGHLKALLPDLATLPVHAFEAFTSPTVGNTTLLDGRTACPNTCLIGGSNAALWTRSATEIIAQLDADLAVLPHHRGLVITSAGVMPPRCEPETIRTVCDWVKSYPVRM